MISPETTMQQFKHQRPWFNAIICSKYHDTFADDSESLNIPEQEWEKWAKGELDTTAFSQKQNIADTHEQTIQCTLPFHSVPLPSLLLASNLLTFFRFCETFSSRYKADVMFTAFLHKCFMSLLFL